jgi:hypothetical protein
LLAPVMSTTAISRTPSFVIELSLVANVDLSA